MQSASTSCKLAGTVSLENILTLFSRRATPVTCKYCDCGHTFCAACIIRYMCAKVDEHRADGLVPLDCPMCRANWPFIWVNPTRNMNTFLLNYERSMDELVTHMYEAFADKSDEEYLLWKDRKRYVS